MANIGSILYDYNPAEKNSDNTFIDKYDIQIDRIGTPFLLKQNQESKKNNDCELSSIITSLRVEYSSNSIIQHFSKKLSPPHQEFLKNMDDYLGGKKIIPGKNTAIPCKFFQSMRRRMFDIRDTQYTKETEDYNIINNFINNITKVNNIIRNKAKNEALKDLQFKRKQQNNNS